MIFSSEKQTSEFAEKMTSEFKGGEVLCLIGDLGSGKTVFAKGLARGLGIKNIITSPTFVLMKIYSGKINLIHIDAYRLSSGVDLKEIGALDYFSSSDSVVVIEWADRVKDIWPEKRIVVKFKVKGKNKREIVVS